MTASSGFSLVGSSMLGSGTSNGGGRTESGTESGIMVLAGDESHAVKRGWDWREGVGPQATASDVLRILRLGLAKDISRGWLEGEV